MRELTDNEKGALVAAGAVAVGAAVLLIKRTGKAEVKVGDSICMDKLTVKYDIKDTLGTVYVNWGLRIPDAQFEEGEGLVGGKYVSGGPFAMPGTTALVTKDYSPLEFAQKPVLKLDASWVEAGEYETWVWLTAEEPTTSEFRIVRGALKVGPKIIIKGGEEK